MLFSDFVVSTRKAQEPQETECNIKNTKQSVIAELKESQKSTEIRPLYKSRSTPFQRRIRTALRSVEILDDWTRE